VYAAVTGSATTELISVGSSSIRTSHIALSGVSTNIANVNT